MPKQSLVQRFFSFDGRLNRWEYFKRIFQLWLISLVVNIVFGRGLGFNTIFGSGCGMLGYSHSSTTYFWGLISTLAAYFYGAILPCPCAHDYFQYGIKYGYGFWFKRHA